MMRRRQFILGGALAGLAGIVGCEEPATTPPAALPPTPPEIEGPFYPVVAQQDTDFDLTRIAGRADVALGEQVFIEGRVIDTQGRPIVGATVDLWQANAAGRYRHPHDPNEASLDPAFQGWAIVPSGQEGGFRFKTIIPGSYPASPGWSRPPHIHFKVAKRGYEELVTQMYFPGQPLNEQDRLLQAKPAVERTLMVATLDAELRDGLPVYTYRLVLRAV